MRSPHYDIHRRGGIAATFELLRDGHTSHLLTRAVRSGEIIRIRQGHYGCPELSLPQQQAVRVGGRLTGSSGLRHYGIWTPTRDELTVVVQANRQRLRSPNDAKKRRSELRRPTPVHWKSTNDLGTRSVVEPLACVLELKRTHHEREVFAAAESAIRGGHFSQSRWGRSIGPGRLALAGRLSESGGESLFRWEMLNLDVDLAQQVVIPGVGRVDFLLGDRLVVEIDGAAFHTSAADFEEDRRRDAALAALGYRVLRFSSNQVELRWPEVARAIAVAIGRGDHL